MSSKKKVEVQTSTMKQLEALPTGSEDVEDRQAPMTEHVESNSSL